MNIARSVPQPSPRSRELESLSFGAEGRTSFFRTLFKAYAQVFRYYPSDGTLQRMHRALARLGAMTWQKSGGVISTRYFSRGDEIQRWYNARTPAAKRLRLLDRLHTFEHHTFGGMNDNSLKLALPPRLSILVIGYALFEGVHRREVKLESIQREYLYRKRILQSLKKYSATFDLDTQRAAQQVSHSLETEILVTRLLLLREVGLKLSARNRVNGDSKSNATPPPPSATGRSLEALKAFKVGIFGLSRTELRAAAQSAVQSRGFRVYDERDALELNRLTRDPLNKLPNGRNNWTLISRRFEMWCKENGYTAPCPSSNTLQHRFHELRKRFPHVFAADAHGLP